MEETRGEVMTRGEVTQEEATRGEVTQKEVTLLVEVTLVEVN